MPDKGGCAVGRKSETKGGCKEGKKKVGKVVKKGTIVVPKKKIEMATVAKPKPVAKPKAKPKKKMVVKITSKTDPANKTMSAINAKKKISVKDFEEDDDYNDYDSVSNQTDAMAYYSDWTDVLTKKQSDWYHDHIGVNGDDLSDKDFSKKEMLEQKIMEGSSNIVYNHRNQLFKQWKKLSKGEMKTRTEFQKDWIDYYDSDPKLDPKPKRKPRKGSKQVKYRNPKTGTIQDYYAWTTGHTERIVVKVK